MHGAIGLGHLRICSHSFRIGDHDRLECAQIPTLVTTLHKIF
jgi:hypothetical protein